MRWSCATGAIGGAYRLLEPQRAAFERLAAAATRDASWECRPAAVGARDGRVVLHVAGNSSSSSRSPMTEQHLASAPESRYVDKEEVDIVRLDSVAPHLMSATDIVFLKADVQGAELDVLQGAAQVLKQTAVVEVELSLVPLYAGAPASTPEGSSRTSARPTGSRSRALEQVLVRSRRRLDCFRSTASSPAPSPPLSWAACITPSARSSTATTCARAGAVPSLEAPAGVPPDRCMFDDAPRSSSAASSCRAWRFVPLRALEAHDPELLAVKPTARRSSTAGRRRRRLPLHLLDPDRTRRGHLPRRRPAVLLRPAAALRRAGRRRPC